MLQGKLEVLKKSLDDNLAKGFIRPGKPSAASLVLFARKHGGELRLCVDCRALNAITIKNRYPIPLVQETLAIICQAKCYTKLDIIASFNKIMMAMYEEWKPAFRTRYGVCGAPSTFQKYINDLLHEYLDNFCTAYIGVGRENATRPQGKVQGPCRFERNLQVPSIHSLQEISLETTRRNRMIVWRKVKSTKKRTALSVTRREISEVRLWIGYQLVVTTQHIRR